MSEAAKLSAALTLSVDATQLHAGLGPAADKAADIFNSRLTQKMSGATVTTGLADKITKSLTSGLDNAALNVNRQVEHMLSSMATSIERHRIGETFARSLNKVNDLIDLHGLTQYRDILGQIVSVHASLSAVRPPSVSPSAPMGPFGQGMPSGNLMPVGAFGHGGGINSPTAIYGAFGVSAPPNRIIAGAFGQGNAVVGQNQAHNIQGAFGVTAPAGRTISGAFGIGSGPNMAQSPTDIAVAQYHADVARQQANPTHARIPTGQWVHAGLPTQQIHTSTPEADAAFRQRYELRPNGNTGNPTADREFREQRALGEALLSNYGQHGRDADNRRMSRQTSHAARFAAQNIGFGVDDAIQSYHYGGIGGSIRAASNNATAIAGMLIPNPAAAAASVVGISIASALAPTLINLSQGIQGKAVTDDKKIHAAGISNQPSYDLSIKKGEGRSLFTKSQNDLLNARVEATTAEKEDIHAQKQWRIKAREMVANVQGSNIIETWGIALNQMTNTGLTGELSTLTEQRNGTLQKRLEARKKQETAEAQYDKAIELAAIEREDSVTAKNYDRTISNRLTQGGFADGAEMAAAIGTNFDEKLKKIQDGPGDKDGKQFRIRNLQMDRADALADPEEMSRRVQLSSSEARQANRSYTERYSGDNSRWAEVDSAYYTQAEVNYRDVVSGNITGDERRRRDGLLFAQTLRRRKRAEEDDITDINPELNPYKNQLRQLERTQEDISLRPKEQQEEQYRAALIAAERRHDNMRPQARSFISQSVVGSVQDEELRARMTGNYGPAIKRDDHKDEDQTQLIAKIEELRQQLSLEVQQIGN